jgi:hypothetical protein
MNNQNFSEAVQSRAQEVSKQITSLLKSNTGNYIDIGYLLSEAKREKYHIILKFDRFQDWAKSVLDTGARTAFYALNIVEKAATLGLGREHLVKFKFSVLKEIFTLDPKEHGAAMKDLMASKKLSLEDAKAKVKTIKGGNGTVEITEGEAAPKLETFKAKVTADQLATIQAVIQQVQATVKLSDGDALAYICQFFADANQVPKAMAA